MVEVVGPSRRNMLKGSLALSSLAATSGLLSACGTGTGSTGTKTQATGKLSLLLGSHMTPLKDQAKAYTDANEISLKVQDVTSPDLRTVLTSALMARRTSWDAVFLTSDLAPEIESRKWLKDVSDIVNPMIEKSGFMQGSLTSVTSGDEITGVPWTVGAPIMHWNKEMFTEVGLDPEAPNDWHSTPNSWDTFVEYAKELTGERNGTQYYGFTDAWADTHVLFTWGSLLQMHGGRFFDDDGNPDFNDEAGIEATVKLRDLLTLHKVVDPAVTTYTWVFDASPGFLNGTRGIFFTWPFIAGVAGDKEQSKIVGKNGFAPQPSVETSASVDGSEFLGLSAFSENEVEARRFLTEMLTPEWQKEFAMAGWASVFRDVNLDPDVLKAFPYYEAMVKSYDYPVDGGFSADKSLWGPILSDQIHEVLTKGADPATALNDAVSKINSERG